MKKEIIELTSKNFDKFVSKGEIVIDFWAEWCGPCKIMEPHFELAAEKFKGKVKFGKVNVEEAQDLAEKFQVMSIPTTIFFKDGEQVNRTVGALDKESILDKIKESFN